jgi:actin-binding protein anillin
MCVQQEPIGSIDLKQCITDCVGLVSRDVCARPNTFELVTVRQQQRGEHDTLVTRCYNTVTTIK